MTSIAAELRGSGDWDDAVEVARLTMGRVRTDVERLLELFPKAGYVFASESGLPVFEPPSWRLPSRAAAAGSVHWRQPARAPRLASPGAQRVAVGGEGIRVEGARVHRCRHVRLRCQGSCMGRLAMCGRTSRRSRRALPGRRVTCGGVVEPGYPISARSIEDGVRCGGSPKK
jgi:hypothetical protein